MPGEALSESLQTFQPRGPRRRPRVFFVLARLVKSASRVPRKDESLVRIRQRALNQRQKDEGRRQKLKIASVLKRRSCGASNAAFRVRILAEAMRGETRSQKRVARRNLIGVPVVER